MELAEKRNIAIWFICSLEVRPEHLLGKGTIAQEHGRPFEIRLAGIPATEFVGDLPSGRVLEVAEKEFMAKTEKTFPDHDVIAWEARLGSPTGTVLSRFRIHVR